MQLQTDNNGSVMFEPCVPHGTERFKVKVRINDILKSIVIQKPSLSPPTGVNLGQVRDV